MIKRLFSVLLCFVLVFSILTITETKSKAIFIADDTVIALVAIGVCANILLSVGVGVASGQGSVYADVAEYVLYHLPADCYHAITDIANYTIQDGVITFAAAGGLYNKIKNWIVNNLGSTIPIAGHLGQLDTTDLIPNSTWWAGYGSNPNYNDNFAATEYPYHSLDYHFNGFYVSWLPTGQLTILHPNGTLIKYSNVFSSYDLSHQYVFAIGTIDSLGNVPIVTGYHNAWNGNNPTNDLGSLPEKTNISSWRNGGGKSIMGIGGGEVTLPNGSTGTTSFSTANGGTVLFNGEPIANNVGTSGDYSKYVVATGSVLSNVENDYFPVNTDSSFTEYEKPIETKEVTPTFRTPVSDDSVVLVPVPGKAVDPDYPAVPLTKNQVKQREKRGQETTVIPEVPDMSDETGQDVGITLVPGRDILDSDTEIPVYNPAFPSVENPGDVTITVTANADIFPTAGNGSTAVPGEGESVSVNTGEIVSDIAKDIVTPLSPEDVEKGGNRMRLPTMLAHKFPFCIPFDLYNAVAMLFAEAEVPVFDFPISVPSLGISEDIHFDFSKYEDIVKVARWFMCAGWILGLILLTKKVIYK